MPEKLFLFDGMALAYRAYFAFISRPLLEPKGENVSAVYGFVSSILKVIDDEKPEHIAVCFDTKEPTFRHKAYKEYKATRQSIPDDMIRSSIKSKKSSGPSISNFSSSPGMRRMTSSARWQKKRR